MAGRHGGILGLTASTIAIAIEIELVITDHLEWGFYVQRPVAVAR